MVPCLHIDIIGTVRVALGPAQHGVGRLISYEYLLFRIPLQCAGYFHGDVAEETYASCPVADLNRRYRIFPSPDAVEPVPVLLFTDIKVDLILSDL